MRYGLLLIKLLIAQIKFGGEVKIGSHLTGLTDYNYYG